MDQEQKPRERSFIRELVLDWRPTREQKLWAVRIVVVLVLLLGILTLIGLPFGITLWDWLQLLIVPAALALAGYLFTSTENRKAQALADRRAEMDREVGRKAQQDDILERYVDQIGRLVLDTEEPLRKWVQWQGGDSLSEKEKEIVQALRKFVRLQTLTVLTRVDGAGKKRVLQSLYETDLITPEHADEEGPPVLYGPPESPGFIDLSGADLTRADLSFAFLPRAALGGRGYQTPGVSLAYAKLQGAYLQGSLLRRANLSRADLSETWLTYSDLTQVIAIEANLTKANLTGSDLRRADLTGANLSGAVLYATELTAADLSRADLSKAELSLRGDEEISRGDLENLEQQAASLQGATMPNGQNYEDWLKSKGRGEE